MRLCVALLLVLTRFVTGQPGSAQTLPTADEIKAKAKAAVPDATNYREVIVSSGALGDTKTTRYQFGKDVRIARDRGGLHIESGTYQVSIGYKRLTG